LVDSSMVKKELLWDLLIKSVKMLVALFTLFTIAFFVESLPYSRSLPFMSLKMPVGVFLTAVVSLLSVIIFIKFGGEISPSVDGILDFMPGAGRLARSIVKVLALLFSYYAFQDVFSPFIEGYEWAYQALFLGFTLFFLARAGLQVYQSSEEISRFLVAALRSGGAPAGAEKNGLSTDRTGE